MSYFLNHYSNNDLVTLNENYDITVNDVLFAKNGNIVTISSQANWTLHGTLGIPNGYRPKYKTIIIVKDTVNNNINLEFLEKGASEYVNNSYVQVFSTWITG